MGQVIAVLWSWQKHFSLALLLSTYEYKYNNGELSGWGNTMPTRKSVME